MQGVIPGMFKTHIVATGVASLLAEKEKPNISEEDIKSIRNLGRRDDLFEVLGNSIAPTIHGNLRVKQSLLL